MPGHSSGQIIHHDCKLRTKPIKSFSSTILDDKLANNPLTQTVLAFVNSIILRRRKRLLNSHLKKSRTRWWERRRHRKSWQPKRNKRILTTLLVSTFQGICRVLSSPRRRARRERSRRPRGPWFSLFTRADDDCHNFLCQASSAEQAATFSSMANDFSCLMKT